jgi:hypothetical protein
MKLFALSAMVRMVGWLVQRVTIVKFESLKLIPVFTKLNTKIY